MARVADENNRDRPDLERATAAQGVGDREALARRLEAETEALEGEVPETADGRPVVAANPATDEVQGVDTSAAAGAAAAGATRGGPIGGPGGREQRRAAHD